MLLNLAQCSSGSSLHFIRRVSDVAASVDSDGYEKIVAGLQEMMYLFLLTFHIPHSRVLLCI